MKRLFLFLSFFIFLFFNDFTVFASTEFDGSQNGSQSGQGSFNGNGSINNEGNMVTYQIYVDTGVTASSFFGSSNSSDYRSAQISGQQYITNMTTLNSGIYSVSQLSKSYIYYIVHIPTGTVFYSNALPSSVNHIFISDQVTFGRGSSSFTESSSGSFNGNFNGSFEGDIILPENKSFGFAPAFPTSTGLSYSTGTYYTNTVKSLSISSSGITIPSDKEFALLPVDFSITLNSSPSVLSAGSYCLAFDINGSFSNTGSFPDYLYSTYVSNAYSKQFNVSITAFSLSRYSSNYPIVFCYFDLYYPNDDFPLSTLNFTVYYYVTENVGSFSLNRNFAGSQNYNWLYRADTNVMLDLQNSANNQLLNIANLLSQQNNSLNSANGANSELNNQNSKLSSSMQQYYQDTDTSKQYSNISDSIFQFDTSIFSSLASTITLFSACVSGIFSAMGDFSVPLILFLTIVFVSIVVGLFNIQHVSGADSDNLPRSKEYRIKPKKTNVKMKYISRKR